MSFCIIVSNQSIKTTQTLCYMDTDSFRIQIYTKDVYRDIVDDVEKRFDTSNYATKRLLEKGKNKKLTELKMDKLDRITIKEFAGLRLKTYSYAIDDGSGDEKAKETNNCVINRRLKFEIYQKFLENNIVTLRSQHRFKSGVPKVFTEEVNITSCPYMM